MFRVGICKIEGPVLIGAEEGCAAALIRPDSCPKGVHPRVADRSRGEPVCLIRVIGSRIYSGIAELAIREDDVICVLLGRIGLKLRVNARVFQPVPEYRRNLGHVGRACRLLLDHRSEGDSLHKGQPFCLGRSLPLVGQLCVAVDEQPADDGLRILITVELVGIGEQAALIFIEKGGVVLPAVKGLRGGLVGVDGAEKILLAADPVLLEDHGDLSRIFPFGDGDPDGGAVLDRIDESCSRTVAVIGGFGIAGYAGAGHCAAVVKRIADAVDLEDSGLHDAVLVAEVPAVSHFDPASLHNAACIAVVPAVVMADPAGLHRTARVAVIPAAIVMDPAGSHHTLPVKAVPAAVDHLPAAAAVFAVFAMPVLPAIAGMMPSRRNGHTRRADREKSREQSSCKAFRSILHVSSSPFSFSIKFSSHSTAALRPCFVRGKFSRRISASGVAPIA